MNPIAFTDVGLYAGAGALVAAVAGGPIGWTALAFAVSGLANRLFVYLASFIKDRNNDNALRNFIILAGSAAITVISIIALHSLGYIAMPGMIALGALGAVSLLFTAASLRDREVEIVV